MLWNEENREINIAVLCIVIFLCFPLSLSPINSICIEYWIQFMRCRGPSMRDVSLGGGWLPDAVGKLKFMVSLINCHVRLGRIPNRFISPPPDIIAKPTPAKQWGMLLKVILLIDSRRNKSVIYDASFDSATQKDAKKLIEFSCCSANELSEDDPD